MKILKNNPFSALIFQNLTLPQYKGEVQVFVSGKHVMSYDITDPELDDGTIHKLKLAKKRIYQQRSIARNGTRSKPDGYDNSEYQKKWREDNLERVQEYQRIWAREKRIADPERAAILNARTKAWRDANKDKTNASRRKRRAAQRAAQQSE